MELNAEQSSKDVRPESFIHWDDYQVVHVATHGKRICQKGLCQAMLIAGLLDNLLPAGPGTKAAKLRALTLEGVTYAKGQKAGVEFVTLNADFFRAQLPGRAEEHVGLSQRLPNLWTSGHRPGRCHQRKYERGVWLERVGPLG